MSLWLLGMSPSLEKAPCLCVGIVPGNNPGVDNVAQSGVDPGKRNLCEFLFIDLPLTLYLEGVASLWGVAAGDPVPKSCGTGDVSAPPTPWQCD